MVPWSTPINRPPGGSGDRGAGSGERASPGSSSLPIPGSELEEPFQSVFLELIHELFEEQVALNPAATALVQGETSLTYGQLNASANQLAHKLIEQGVKPDAPVALCSERRPHLVVALLAILKAGGAYVPLDPAYPLDRLRFMLEDSKPLALLTQAHLQEIFAGLDSALPILDLADKDAR